MSGDLDLLPHGVLGLTPDDLDLLPGDALDLLPDDAFFFRVHVAGTLGAVKGFCKVFGVLQRPNHSVATEENVDAQMQTNNEVLNCRQENVHYFKKKSFSFSLLKNLGQVNPAESPSLCYFICQR